MRFGSETFRNLLNPGLRASAADWRGSDLHAIAGIGNPNRFFAQLQQLGPTSGAPFFPTFPLRGR